MKTPNFPAYSDSAQRPGSPDPLDDLAAKIREQRALVAVLGLGHVGLPLLVGIHEAGFRVLGLETDLRKMRSLREGRSHLVDVSDSEVAALDRATFHADARVLADADVCIICVPTPLTDSSPDLTLVRTAAEEVASNMRPGTLIILESTTYPGTTEEVLRPILEELSGLRLGAGFALAYSPERIDPGDASHSLENTPKVLAGVTRRCRELATSFYSQFVTQVVTTSTPREAEMAKLIENTYRQVNIALVNELAILARGLGVDIWEALEAAATKPFGYEVFWPGPGVGGHCISIDPSYLSWTSGAKLGYRIGFIEHANEVNNRMPDYVYARVAEALNDHGKPIRGSSILCVGVAYKPGVNDRRESPALAVVERLFRNGAEISYNDQYVEEIDLEGNSVPSVALTDDVLAAHDMVIVLTPHPGIDWHQIVQVAPLVFDTRGVTSGFDAPNVMRL